jgi:hypothetical protein
VTESAELLISISLEDGYPTELDELTRELKSEIEQLSADSVDNVSEGEAPAGTKAADWVSIGNMAVTLAPTIIPPLFELLKSWIDRKPSTPVKIKIKVGKKTAQVEYDPTKTSAKDLETLVKSLSKTVKK